MKASQISSSPLNLVLCRHEGNEVSRTLASSVRIALRGNSGNRDVYLATLSDLPVPLRDFSVCPQKSGFDPVPFLSRALHTQLVVFLDEEMERDKEWMSWLRKCLTVVTKANGRHHMVIMCLDDSVKNRFQKLASRRKWQNYDVVGYEDRQKNNTPSFGEYAERPAWFSLYVFQCCRRLLTTAVFQTLKNKKVHKLRLFISHAKKDSLPLANSVRYALEKKEYFKTWYDAKDLAGVDDWRKEIKEGVRSSVVVVLRTEKYDTRPWCRQEFLWAEQCGVPIVCVEARTVLETGADALSSSRVPTVRIPDGNLFRVLFAALKESLRILRLQRLADQWKQVHAGVKKANYLNLIPYTPTLKQLTLASEGLNLMSKSAPRGGASGDDFGILLYADPPLSTELYQASKQFVESKAGMKTYLLTPSLLPFWAAQENVDNEEMITRSLAGKKINISVSEEVRDLPRLGFTQDDVNEFTVQLAEAVIANEGIVALGHDWRDDGVMQHIYRIAEENQDMILDYTQRKGLVENYLYWGSKPALNAREQGHLKGILDFNVCEIPDDPRFEGLLSIGDLPEELRGYAMARSLTVMRRQMTENTIARVCLGGRDMDRRKPERGPLGRCPGVVEEAYLSCLCDQPLYLSGLLGGVTARVIHALLGREASLEFELPDDVERYYTDESARPGDMEYEGPLPSAMILDYFAEYGLRRLSERNQLSEKENLRLFEATTLDEVRDLVLTGLSRLMAVST